MADFDEKPNVSLMHIFISIIITVGVWIYSFTLLFPLLIFLKLSENFRKLFFSRIFHLLGKLLSGKINPMRKKTFELMPPNLENMKMLEVGVGEGANFEYYPENVKVSLLDMNENFESEMRKRLENFPSIKVEKYIIAMAENMTKLADSEFDIVVCTHLLCSVRDANAVLREVHRVLKPDGKFVYMEHVGFPKHHIGYWIQTCLSPLFCIYMNGCHLNRHSQAVISNYFPQNSYKFSYLTSLPLFIRPHVIGIASK